MNFTACKKILAALLVSLAAAPAPAALLNVPGLATVRVWESTGPFTPYDFAAAGPQMANRVGVLGPSSNDFASLPFENYDVFYSDADGTFNPNGDFISVECDFPVVTPQPGGGGLNLGAVDLLDAQGNLLARADKLMSWYGRGTNFIPGSELLAVDADTFPIPSTDTTMGNTAPGPAVLRGPLRVTVGFSAYCVPEPSAGVLVAFAATLAGLRRRLAGCDSQPA